MDNRQVLRREMRHRRRALSVQQQQSAARDLFRLLSRQPLFLRSRHIALYLANDGEISPQLLLDRALRMGKRCYLPVLAPGTENRLWFVRYDHATRLVPNRYGIPEPQPAPKTTLPAARLDLVLMPLVAFDAHGGRLGMGGGYYDRSFAFKRRLKNHSPYLLGLSHSCQQTEKLALADWDIPLHGIATEKRIFVSQMSGSHRDFKSADLSG